jgi:outer membrane protein assembly factor BamB
MTTRLPNLAPPLRLAWTRALDSEATMLASPVVRSETVVARCGRMVAGLSLRDGTIRWQVEVTAKDRNNRFLAAARRAVITTSEAGADTEVAALSWTDGSEVWKTPIRGAMMREGLALGDQRLLAITARQGDANLLTRLRLDGTSQSETPMPIGASHPVVHGGRLFFGSRALQTDDAGLHVLDASASDPLRILRDPVGRVRGAATVVVAATESAESGTYELVAVDPKRLEVLWSAPNDEFVLDAEGRDVVGVELGPSGGRAVLRDGRDGAVRWRSAAFEEAATRLFLAGDSVAIQVETGIVLLDRRDGAVLDRIDDEEQLFSWGGGLAPGRLLVGHGNAVACYVSTTAEPKGGR